MTALAVALFGGLGALARYGVDGVVAARYRSPFPLGTLLINVSGSVCLGALTGAVQARHLAAATLVWAGTGFLGGYTTFSTFAWETVRLVEDGARGYAAWNVLLSGPLAVVGAALAYLVLR